ncbi:hypothetical protein CGRA01v4_06434 [Colletotrichum graminicola]|nr:hypothetical protein CGRA01v4_06434 [Colletotrichum graminicola]
MPSYTEEALQKAINEVLKGSGYCKAAC